MRGEGQGEGGKRSGIIPPHLNPFPPGERKIKVYGIYRGEEQGIFFYVEAVEQAVETVHDNPGNALELGPVFLLGFAREELEGLRDAELLQPAVQVEGIADPVGDGAVFAKGMGPCRPVSELLQPTGMIFFPE